jgi:GDP-L-fucose synthase
MKLLILGAKGLIGTNSLNYFQKQQKYDVFSPSHKELDLLNQDLVNKYFKRVRPDLVIMSAARVGGIGFNQTYPSQLILDNLQISTNTYRAALEYGVSKLINFGSSCMYPVNSNQPMKVSSLEMGLTERTSQFYASYKIASWKIVEAINQQFEKNWITIIPATIYGPYDNFSLTNGHVISSLIKKFKDAENQSIDKITLWGDGTPLREFIFIEDLIRAIEFVIEKDQLDSTLNIGSQFEVSIADLAKIIANIVGFKGKILWDETKANGVQRKLLDSSYIKSLGWEPKTTLKDGISLTCSWLDEFGVNARV